MLSWSIRMNSHLLALAIVNFYVPYFQVFMETLAVFQVLITFYFLGDSICFIIYNSETFLIYHVFLFVLTAREFKFEA